MNITYCTAARKVFCKYIIIETGSVHILSKRLLQGVGMLAYGEVKKNTFRD
jgi:hypothetical protein